VEEGKPGFRRPLWLRWVGIGLGVVSLFWLQVEDLDSKYVVVLSALWSAWFAVWFLLNPTCKPGLGAFARAGLVSGLAVAPFAVLLVIFKGGIHAHGFLDLTNDQIGRVLHSTPLWGLLGLVVAFISGLSHRNRD
jgi:hypothetical protein